MQIRIIRAFIASDSPRPFLPQDLVTVADDVADQWIAEGKALPYNTDLSPIPPKPKRERATR
jgi:hypothetical protein